MTIERAHRILGRGYTREEARRLLTACGLLLDAAESAYRTPRGPASGDGHAAVLAALQLCPASAPASTGVS